ncbi:winged helix-turn-helix domain-containing protein [Lysobacter sp. TAF61]|uniref:winged helix-turn-helix domain-containing protein n=1 Tax=Lysobacter sp. TAF61 TaxID=3233072 RepID=UPI003F97F69E
MRLTRYRFGEFELDPASRELKRAGLRVALPPKSFDCLAYLIANRERAVGRDELIAAVWGKVDVSDTVVAQTMLRARKALDDTGNRQSIIRTVSRFGYHWIAPVEEAEAEVFMPASSADAAIGEPATAAVVDVPTQLPSAAVQPATAHPPAVQQPPLRPRERRYLTVIVLAALLVAVVAAGWAWYSSRAPRSASMARAPQAGTVMVLPVRVTPIEAESTWVRLGAMDYIASRLRSSGVKVLPSDHTLHLSTQSGYPSADGSTALEKLEQGSGAQWILAPEAMHDSRGWRIRLRVLQAGKEHVIDAQGTTPLTAAAAVTDSWLQRTGRHSGEHGAPSPLTERVQRIDAELISGQLAAARRLIETAPPEQRREPRLRVREGQLEYRAGRADEAAAIFSSILETRPIDLETEAKTRMGLGAVEIRRGNFAAAQTRYTEALSVLESSRDASIDPSLLGNAYNGRGVAQVEQEKMAGAVQDMGRARIAMQRAGDLVEAAMVDTNLGIIESKRGHFEQALQEFDRAIAVFERFEVHDYLAATLSSRAATELKLAQPAAALATIERSGELAKSLEDTALAISIGTIRTRALLANGRLDAAAQSLDRLRALQTGDANGLLMELQLQLLLAKGDTTRAGAIARQLPDPSAPTRGALALAAVQAALRNGDVATARQWVSRAQAGNAGVEIDSVAWGIARALVDDAAGDHAASVLAMQRAASQAEQGGSPDERVSANVAHALLLLDAKQEQAAAAVLGDLSTFAGSDYRVAWAMLALYRALDDRALAEQAQAAAQSLRGQRDLAVRPVL